MKQKTDRYILLNKFTSNHIFYNRKNLTVLLLVMMSFCYLVVVNGIFLGRMLLTVDVYVHLQWLSDFNRALLSGWFYPKWAIGANFGQGEPVFLYYAPLYYYFNSVLMNFFNIEANQAIIVSGLTILNLLFAIGYILAGSRRISTKMLCGFSLCLCPIFIFLFLRQNALPWFFSTPALVLSLISIEKIYNLGFSKRFFIVGVLSICIVALSHTLSAFMLALCSSIVLIVNVIFNIYIKKSISNQIFCLCILFLGIGLACFYLLPAVLKTNLISFDGWFDNQYLTYKNSFILPFVTSFFHAPRWNLVNWYFGSIVLFFYIILLLETVKKHQFSFLHGFSGLALFFASEVSYPLWWGSNTFAIVQCPFRYIVPAFAAILVLNIAQVRDHLGSVFFSLLITVLSAFFVFQSTNSNSTLHTISFSDLYPGRPEYVLKGFKQNGKNTEKKLHNEIRYNENGITVPCDSIILNDNNAIIPVRYFPNWRLSYCGKFYHIAVERNGLIRMEVPMGISENILRNQCDTDVLLTWKMSKLEWAGLFCSLLSLILISTIVMLSSKYKYRFLKF